jgi:hypothetical protein
MTPKTKGLLIAAAVVVAGAIIVAIIIHFTAPKDTPIVAGGGSIYGETSSQDTVGWKAQGKLQYASLHATPGTNPNGIDNLIFTNFDNNPANPITGTGGWVILFSNPDVQGHRKLTPAVLLCSDNTCSASYDNPSRCQGTFDTSSNVYFGVRTGNRIKTQPGAPTKRIDFDDTDQACASRQPNPCNKVYDARVETCSGVDLTLTCSENPTSCAVKVGNGTP